MKDLVKFGVIGAVAVAAWYVLKGDKEQQSQDTGEKTPESAPPPPPPQAGGQTVPFSINSGEGKVAIEERAKIIAMDPERGRSILSQTSKGLYQGLEFSTDLKSWMGELFGNPNNVPVFSKYTNPDYKKFLEDLQEPDYRQILSERGRQGASTIVRPLFQYRDLFTFWGPEIENGLSAARDNERFAVPGSSSANRDTEMRRFVESVQAMAKNAIEKQRQFDQALQSKAIEELRRQGWKFIEIDPPA